MKKLYSVGETAKLAGTTIASLHHYDKIGLLKPAKIDEHTGYRYYSDNELIYLDVINFCKQKNMSLESIKKVFENDNFNYIVDFLQEKEQDIDREITRLKNTRQQINRLKSKFLEQASLNPVELSEVIFTEKQLKERAIVKINSLDQATIENFNLMIDKLYEQIGEYLRDDFIFVNKANIITTIDSSSSKSSFFAECKKYPQNADCVTFLPEGTYICAYCSEQQRKNTIKNIISFAKNNYNTDVNFIVQSVIFTGMFKWIYEIQVLVKN